MNENPYAPPSADLRLPHEPNLDAALKRPASSKWAIAVLFFFSVSLMIATAMLWKTAGGGISAVVNLRFAFAGVFALASLIAFVSMLAGRRKAWCYYVVSLYLAVLAIRGVWVGYQFTLGQSPGYGAYRNQPVFEKVVSVVFLLLLVLLFARFTFGKASRLYYRVSQPKQP